MTTVLDTPAAVFGETGEASSSPVLRDAAYAGVIGEIVRAIEPHTEAAPAAVLAQATTMLGSALGRTPHVRVEADRHGPNLFVVIVGETGRSRKGTSRAQAQRPVSLADPEWAENCIQSGLSSGEGLIHAVRNAVTKPVDGEDVTTDEGVEDKRLLVLESEFASTLRVMARDGSTLSAVIRQAWDGGTLKVLTKNSPTSATDPHISLIGHITDEELRRELSATDQSNGFANRFLYVHAARSKLLPEGGAAHLIDWQPIVRRLDAALSFARSLDRPVDRDPEARELWIDAYGRLTAGSPGMLGAITSRAEAQVTRLSLIYAVLDRSSKIKLEHLQAALAIWDYSEASCRHIFGDQLGDPDADGILRAIRQAPEGLTRTQIRDLFGRHRKSVQIDRCLALLLQHGLARVERQETGGRPSERWVSGP